MIYYTSDMHFNHNNIIKLCGRPFKSIEEMNNTIIKNWNNVVKKEDIVYILGDVSHKDDVNETVKILNKLNGEKHLIVGNHDKHTRDSNFRSCFKSIKYYNEIFDGERQIVLFHYPIAEWNGYFKNAVHLYGHVHENIKFNINNRYNVSTDVWNFCPVTLKQIMEGSKYGK